MTRQRFEGTSLDEALEKAAKALDVPRYAVSYFVVVEKRGFLGGLKRVVIEAEANEAALEKGPPEPPKPQPQPARSTRESGPRRRSEGRHSEGQHGRRGEARGRIEREKRARGGESVTDQLRPAISAPPVGDESTAAVTVREWLEEVVDRAELELEVRAEEREEEIHVELYGRDGEYLLRNNGELLDSLQVLANKALVGRSVEKSIELDHAGLKEHREEALRRRALELAEEVRREGTERTLPAMSPIERRIVHLAIQEEDAVTTESRGSGFYKRVVLRPRGEEAAGGEP